MQELLHDNGSCLEELESITSPYEKEGLQPVMRFEPKLDSRIAKCLLQEILTLALFDQCSPIGLILEHHLMQVALALSG